ncbi:protocadherin beta-15-like isoform X1 [Sinocyclocheilus grahami]|uniref:protocadherin beta-15-like isoform X1 n=1 Tax=Sinocyclocheilus grahami TaxID=75366 RepID=UPI0007AC877F|nr:PREDICTED: protocadherin beta-15-like isoform X1 [Sinocyclocheilus grahami]
MDRRLPRRRWTLAGQVVCLLLCACALDRGLAQIRYSVPEELEHGAFVGNIAEDLGLDVAKLSSRRFRIVSGARKQYLEVNLENGIIFVNEKIDREELCEQSPVCFLHLQVVIESPLELYRVEVEILDVNDNAPSFPWSEFNLEITESAAPGSRFPLESAQDLDVGSNSLRSYLLSANQHFVLDIQARNDGSKFAELVLQSPLDREQQKTHEMVLTAVDGGSPLRSGTAQITVTVLDANDNVPVFDRSVYRVSLVENAPRGTLVLKLNATDLDEGANGEITYSFSGHAPLKVRELFSVDSHSGEIRVKGIVDYEKASVYELYVQAKDKGPSAVAVHCKVLVDILDVNDNAPEVILTSVSTPVQEDAPPGTVIAVISVMDRDSGENGAVDCQIPGNVPFQLHSSFKNYYTLVTSEFLDRESVSEYNITLTARDLGSPPLSTRKTILVQVSDINDNPPRFIQPSYTVYVTENNAPGASICSLTAFDPDSNQNAYLSYSILEGQIQGMPVSTYVSINSDNGNIYALRSFDYEQLRNFQIRVQAQDAGFPPLSSNVTVNVFVLDQNDNAPVILSPLPRNGTVATEMVPRSVDAGYLVAKITALDADAGQNSRLSYQMLQATDPGLFSVALYTGEIRTIRRFLDKDAIRQRLVILVKDNGQPPLSATVSIILSVVDSVPESLSNFGDLSLSPQPPSNLALYLIVSLSTISLIFLVAIIVLAAVKCYKDRDSLGSYALSSLGTACCSFEPEPPAEVFKKSNLNLQIATGAKVPTNCVEVNSNPGNLSQAYCYKVCLTPESAKSDFMFLKPCSPGTPRNNAARGADNLALSSQSRCSSVNNGATTPNELKQANTDWALTKNQTSSLKSCNSINMDGTLMRKAMQAEPENYMGQMATGQYWTWGTRSREYQMHSPAGSVSQRAWTPHYTPQHNPTHHLQQQQPTAQVRPHPPPDYQHNVYIPGTPSGFCTLRPSYRSELDVHNSFSTFGKKRRFISPSSYDPHDDTGAEVINNDLYNE